MSVTWSEPTLPGLDPLASWWAVDGLRTMLRQLRQLGAEDGPVRWSEGSPWVAYLDAMAWWREDGYPVPAGGAVVRVIR